MTDFKLYRFSPITSQEQLLSALTYIHHASYELCRRSFGANLPNAGNIGIFCHYNDEFNRLIALREVLCEPSDNPDLKYFTLCTPLIIPAKDDTPETTYTHLYVRKPDPYRAQVGDIDFILDENEYANLTSSLQTGGSITGARLFDRSDLDMVELYSEDIDVLAYVSTHRMSQKVRIKLSDATKL